MTAGPLQPVDAAQRLRDVDAAIRALHQERAALVERLVAEQRSALAPQPGAQPVAAPRRRLGAQRLLLVSGVVLVATAAIGFAAVVVASVGVLGQAAVLLALCAAAGAGSRVCARRDLGGSAEALAVLAVAVLVVVVAAAHGQGLLGLDALDAEVWALVGLALVSAACAAAAVGLRVASTPRAYGWAAVATAALLPSVLVAALDAGAPTWSAAALVLAVLSAVAAPRVRRHARGLSAGVLVAGAVHLAGALLVALVVAAVHADDADVLSVAVQLAALVPCAGVVARWSADRRPRTAGVSRTTGWVAAAGAPLCLAALGGPLGLLVLGGGAALATAAVLGVRVRVPWPAPVAAQAAAGLALLLEPAAVGVLADPPGGVRPVAWALLAASTAVTGAVRPAPGVAVGRVPSWAGVPVGWAAASTAAALLGAALLPGEDAAGPRTAAAVVVGGAALALAALAAGGPARRRGAPHPGRLEAVLVTGWALGTLLAVASATGAGAPVPPEAVLALAGAEALAFSVLPRRLAHRPVGVALLSAAWWVLLDGRPGPVEPVEWWSVPPAVLALLAGALSWRRHPGASSWAVLGPGLVVGLLPTVALSLDQSAGTSVARPVATVLVSAALCAVGAARSWQAPLVTGAVAGTVVALGRLGPYAVEAPLWASLGTAGALVLVLAVRIEQARRDAARAATWVRALR